VNSVKNGLESCKPRRRLVEGDLVRLLLSITGDLLAVILVTCCLFMLFGDSAMLFDADNGSGGYGMLGMIPVTAFLVVSLRVFMGWSAITSQAYRYASATTPVPDKAQTLEKILSESHDYVNGSLPKGVVVINEYMHARAQDSFVAQSGPVCAAASVAGALNIIFNYKTDNEKVRQLFATKLDILLMCHMCVCSTRCQKHTSFLIN
jgi:hypothetical protein